MSQRAAESASSAAENVESRISDATSAAEASQFAADKAKETVESSRAVASRVEEHLSQATSSVEAGQRAAGQAHQAAQIATSTAERVEERVIQATSSLDAGQRVGEQVQQAADAAAYAFERVEGRIREATSALEASQRAAERAQEAATRAESTASSFEATANDLREAAERTRDVVVRVDERAASANSAANSAQLASVSAAEAARRAESAGSTPNLGPDADTLLGRLENDYQLLTTLVQDLVSRIGSMANVAASQAAEAETNAVEAQPWESSESPPVESYEAPIALEAMREISVEPTADDTLLEPVVEAVEPQAVEEEPAAFNPAWIETTISYPAPRDSEPAQPESTDEPAEAVSGTPAWRVIEAEPAAMPLEAWSPSTESAVVEEEVAALETESTPEEPVGPGSELAGALAPELVGRVQINISPVPDFDRLLNLDSALSRVSSVQTVTLADYAQEEVTFRIDLTSPLNGGDFARQLAEAAGFDTEVVQVDASSLTLRIA